MVNLTGVTDIITSLPGEKVPPMPFGTFQRMPKRAASAFLEDYRQNSAVFILFLIVIVARPLGGKYCSISSIDYSFRIYP